MASISAIFSPQSAAGGIENVTKVTALAAGASSSEISLGTNQLFAITGIASSTAAAPLNMNVEFGPAGLGAATAADMGLPLNQVFTFDTGEQFKSIRVYNNATTGAIDVYVMKLSKS